MRTLISFLGKGRHTSDGGYATVAYQFGGERWEPTAYFGQALAQRLDDVDKLIVVGTASSSWDIFGLDMTAADEAMFDAFAALGLDTAVRANAVTQPLLDKLAPLLSRRLGMAVVPVLTGFAKQTAEQAELLHALSRHVTEKQSVVLDVTHGFRHLPMLALVAARFLSHVRKARIEGIYYGALEMKGESDAAPVLDLSGMLTLLDWTDALASYEKDGDYGVFAELMHSSGMSAEHAAEMRRAAFYERASSAEQARAPLGNALGAIERHPDPVAALFADELRKRMAWARRPDRAARELALADAYFERRDYLRSVLFLFEGLITREVWRGKGDPSSYDARDAARKKLREQSSDFKTLDAVRNALAHGLRSHDVQAQRWLADEEALRQRIRSVRKALLPMQ